MDFLNNKESRMRKIPAGARRGSKKRKNISRVCLNYDFSGQDIILIKAFLAERFTQYPDMLKCKQISEETGLSTSTIVEMAKKECFTSITVKSVFLVSKQSFIDYASSNEFYSLRSYSKSFISFREEILRILHKPDTELINTVESAVKHNENKNERRLSNE